MSGSEVERLTPQHDLLTALHDQPEAETVNARHRLGDRAPAMHAEPRNPGLEVAVTLGNFGYGAYEAIRHFSSGLNLTVHRL
jgi:hypothetical protein